MPECVVFLISNVQVGPEFSRLGFRISDARSRESAARLLSRIPGSVAADVGSNITNVAIQCVCPM